MLKSLVICCVYVLTVCFPLQLLCLINNPRLSSSLGHMACSLCNTVTSISHILTTGVVAPPTSGGSKKHSPTAVRTSSKPRNSPPPLHTLLLEALPYLVLPCLALPSLLLRLDSLSTQPLQYTPPHPSPPGLVPPPKIVLPPMNEENSATLSRISIRLGQQGR